MTPEHKFQLLLAGLSIIPATALSAWALIHQRRQTTASLDVLMSPIFSPTIDGKSILGNDWPGVVVRNQSTFSLRLCSIGYCVGKRFYSFEKPMNGSFALVNEWPFEITPRSRVAFYPSPRAQRVFQERGLNLIDSKGKKLLEVARAYAMTECNKHFLSPKISRKTLRRLREAEPLKDMTAVS